MANNLRKLWDTDEDARPRERRTFADDMVGRFRSGRLVGKMPESLNEWRVTTGDPIVADKIAELFGGTPESWETEKEDSTEILTAAASVKIVINSSSDLDASMKKFGFNGLEHHCDGYEFLSPDEDKGEACGCPPTIKERKDRATAGRGPKPSIDLTFTLQDAPEIGKFRFNSGSWSLVNVLADVIADIDAHDGAPVYATLAIEHVSFDTKAGAHREFNKPVIKVTGAVASELPAAA